VTNPFENDEAEYIVLANAQNQHSLWPVGISVPDGWAIVHEADSRAGCLAYVEENWTDLRPSVPAS
jgi:uncharacterized protein YbdZ (MbtH family)